MPREDESRNQKRDAIGLATSLTRYRKANSARASVELMITAIPFAIIWALMLLALTSGHVWLYGLLILPAAAFLVRLFLIQHDCGHHSFFENDNYNDWAGRLISVLTLTPYDYWRHSHTIHHATSGNLASRGVGDVNTLTVSEYLACSPWQRLRYRAYRHPAVMFGIGPVYLFVLQHRLPAGFMRQGWGPWLSTMITNVAVTVAFGLMIWAIGLRAFLLIHVPIVLLAAVAGVWLFYVQHQFEQTYWAKDERWSVHDAALRGSSHYELPAVLAWFTANIGVHHVHHLCSRIPYYRLQDVLRDQPALRAVGRITLRQSLQCVRLALWDEGSQRLISFRQLRSAQAIA
jgi:omega-6 fatty acid desaturase (delta-12 desaturase)